eukprot:gnl/TRDRNA2_/TRDRNA2_207904_c0_seq1.p1 gnl/TRDRNA2_/TRDRNA2_207904_c0~~gnl/TRDRNA2_/TRDRNA2_207904_c0_seq1.p1  ORF type:complete len:231 (+),score=20.30 gnl/TRDRNA2_/TRDRNA2_207904_c0_seq1:63-755(+)
MPTILHTWTCGCGELQLKLEGQPYLIQSCLCDDCHIRWKVGQSKEKEPGTFNKFAADGGTLICSWWGKQIECTKGFDKMTFFRSAVKNKGTESNDKTTVVNIACADCGTMAGSTGLGLMCVNVGPNFERLQDGAASNFPKAPPITMASYCPITGVSKPAGASHYLPCGMACGKILPIICCACCMPGRGKQPFMQSCAVSATEFCGKPMEYLNIGAIKALPFPSQQKMPGS